MPKALVESSKSVAAGRLATKNDGKRSCLWWLLRWHWSGLLLVGPIRYNHNDTFVLLPWYFEISDTATTITKQKQQQHYRLQEGGLNWRYYMHQWKVIIVNIYFIVRYDGSGWYILFLKWPNYHDTGVYVNLAVNVTWICSLGIWRLRTWGLGTWTCDLRIWNLNLQTWETPIIRSYVSYETNIDMSRSHQLSL